MKFLIAPSKTQKTTICEFKTHNITLKDPSDHIETFINTLTEDTYAIASKLDVEKSAIILEEMQNPKYFEKAIECYTGLVYKQLNLNNYTQVQKQFLHDNIIIASARYGILQANDYISKYRLDFKMKFSNFDFKKYWKPVIREYLDNNFKNEIIVSLASKEFNDLFDSDRLLIIDFIVDYNGQLKRPSTLTKQMRGQFLNYIILNQIDKQEQLKLIEINEFFFQEKLSTQNKLVFVKKL